jgi:L-ascorbate metabolism protein UlaG (beta-lactamase superfamily)
MNLTYFGHSCFLIETKDAKILFDPFIRNNELAAHIDPLKIQTDYILISHGHFDHLSDAEEIALNTHALLIANWEIYSWYLKKGLKNLQPMNSGGKLKTSFGSIVMTPAIHSSSLPDGSYGGNPNGFVLHSDEMSVYYSGDTDIFLDMQLIAKYNKPKYAFLPIGNIFTMDIHTAIESAKLLQVNRVIGLHYDTFPPIQIDKEEAKRAFEKEKIELILLEIGETRILS